MTSSSFGEVASLQDAWIDYADAEAPLRGYWVQPNSVEKLPTVVVVHTFRGITKSIERRARRLAEEGYAVFALDVFGPDIRPADHLAGLETIKPFRENRAMFRKRLRAGLDVAREQLSSDRNRMAAIGYCFGGSGVLEMARAGMPLRGVVSLHGELGSDQPAERGVTVAKVLALHGDADPIVKANDVAAFQEEMREALVDWEFVSYAGAKHSFTGEGLGSDSDPNAAFAPQAEARSWARQNDFLQEVLAR